MDLTKLPCVSIDAERTAFRDDAFGIRPRADTGRRVIPDASKWEILIHIVDVSDIYTASASSNESLRFLKEAAMKRGMSRYDLPLGPLHLLPPRVLDLLSFSKDRKQQEAVTLWAYIDERDGKLLDAGLERTCVSTPWNFSFSEATSLLDGAVDDVTTREAAKARALLLVVERNLKMWSQRRLQANKEVRKREARLEARQRQAPLNSGVRSFERTRAHRLVDASLDLYGSTLWYLLRQAKAPVPVAAGADISRGGRVATAPLRRYIDGEAQRQALAVLCGYGEVLSAKECKEIGRTSNEARNSISNFRALRNE